MMVGYCRECRYWRVATSEPNGDSGECHRHAPTVVLRMLKGDGTDAQHTFAEFPLVNEEDFCGDFAPQILSLSVRELELSTRAHQVLQNEGIETIDQLCEKTSDGLRAARNCGAHTVLEIQRALRRLGLSLRGDKT